MGITTYLFHKSDDLEKQRFNMFFLDMGENIHFHYRDLRIELSVGEFIELAEQFNRYAKDVLKEIERGYKDGVLVNTNEAGTLKTFWDKERRLENQVKYHENHIAVEETRDGYHLHIRNYKILLHRESFRILVGAIAPIFNLLERENLRRDPFDMLVHNELQPRLVKRVQTANSEELTVEVAKPYRKKAGQVLEALGFSEEKSKGETCFIAGNTVVNMLDPVAGGVGGDRDFSPGVSPSPVPLSTFLRDYGSELEPDALNELKLKILSLLKMAEKNAIGRFRLDELFVDQRSCSPMIDLFSADETVDIAKQIDKFSKLLVKYKLFFVKPKKKYFSRRQTEQIEDRFFTFVMEKLAIHECVKKISVLGSSTRHAIGSYSVPFVHFDWVKLNSDFDVYIEMDPEEDAPVPEAWEKKFYWSRAGCDYYHFGELGDGMASDMAGKYPHLRFYDHLVEGYLFNPVEGDRKKRDKWFSEIHAVSIFSRDRTAQWIVENYPVSASETERFSIASFNRVYKVMAEPHNYVLKIYDEKHLSSKNVKKITYEIKVLDSLKESGIEVALPVKNNSGGYITRKGKEKAVLFTFAPGDYIADPSKEQITMAAHLLGRFHREAKKCRTSQAKKYSNKETVIYWLKAWQEYHEKKVPGTDVPVKVRKLINIVDELNTYASHCHGDLSLINYLFDKDRCWLIDFQSIGYGPALIDLANAMVEFSARKNKFLFDNLQIFRDGYEEVRSLGRKEEDHLIDLLIVQIVARQAKLIRLHYGGFGYELKKERLFGLREGLAGLIQRQ